jgi:hypothetical protein
MMDDGRTKRRRRRSIKIGIERPSGLGRLKAVFPLIEYFAQEHWEQF